MRMGEKGGGGERREGGKKRGRKEERKTWFGEESIHSKNEGGCRSWSSVGVVV